MHRIAFVVSLVLLPMQAAFAQTSDPDPAGMTEQEREDYATELSAQGTDAFRAEDYEGAIALFRRAYGYFEDPVLLFNIARCHDKAGQAVEAAEAYWVAIETGRLDGDTAGRARGYIADLAAADLGEDGVARVQSLTADAEAASSSGDYGTAADLYRQAYQLPSHPLFADAELLLKAAESLTEEGSALDQALSDYDTVLSTRGVTAEQERRAQAGQRRVQEIREQQGGLSGLQVAGLAASGVGLLAFIGGALVDSGLDSTIQDYEDAAAAGDEARYDSLQADIDSGQGTATMLYVVGGVLVAGGVVVFLVGGDSTDAPEQGAYGTPGYAVTPFWTPGAAGLTLEGSF